MIGIPVLQVIVPIEHPDTNRKLEDMLVGKSIPLYERTFRRKDGTTFPAEVNVALVHDPQGAPLHIHSIVRDISERKQAEEELRKHRDHLEDLVQERTAELRRVVNLMAGREVRMAELKETIHHLQAQLAQAGIVPVDRDTDPAGTTVTPFEES
jgi:hypothetical protein